MKAHISWTAFALAMLLLIPMFMLGQGKQAAPSKDINPAAQGQNQSKDGERLFQVHCGRCHQPPQEIPPQISGTVLKHMRVRALLTPEDERLILKYLAP